MRNKIQRFPVQDLAAPSLHCPFLLSSVAQPALSSFPAQRRAELADNEEMAGRGRSFSKVPLEIQGTRFTVEERKEKK